MCGWWWLFKEQAVRLSFQHIPSLERRGEKNQGARVVRKEVLELHRLLDVWCGTRPEVIATLYIPIQVHLSSPCMIGAHVEKLWDG